MSKFLSFIDQPKYSRLLGLAHLTSLCNLQTLRLRCGKKVNDLGMHFLSRLSLLKLLLCDAVNLTNETIRLVASSQHSTLQKFVFAQSDHVTQACLVHHLAKLTKLTELRLECCATGDDLEWEPLPGGGMRFFDLDFPFFNQ